MNTEKKTWLSIHSYVSMLFLPLALTYAITGGLSALGLSNEHGARPGPPLRVSGSAGTRQPGMERTEGEAGGRFQSGEPKPGSTNQGLYSKLVLLHKAKGSPAFVILAISFAVAMLLIYLSGIWMCWQNRNIRKRMLVAAALGLIVTVAVVATAPVGLPIPPPPGH